MISAIIFISHMISHDMIQKMSGLLCSSLLTRDDILLCFIWGSVIKTIFVLCILFSILYLVFYIVFGFLYCIWFNGLLLSLSMLPPFSISMYLVVKFKDRFFCFLRFSIFFFCEINNFVVTNWRNTILFSANTLYLLTMYFIFL